MDSRRLIATDVPEWQILTIPFQVAALPNLLNDRSIGSLFIETVRACLTVSAAAVAFLKP